MERTDHAIAAFFAHDPLVEGGSVTLGEEEAHHMRVRRMEIGERVVLLDGAGHRASGTLVRVARANAVVEVSTVETALPLPAVHVMVPVADRERMLWLAEKCVELAATTWRPVTWRRSKSVSPRGEGATFQHKVRARMANALTQSHGLWLPTLFPEANVERAIAASPVGTRLLLDPEGSPLLVRPIEPPVIFAVGPEGGIERDEKKRFIEAGFMPVSLAGHMLRFETAAVAALAIVRAALAVSPEAIHG